jgi:hypothetical protein
MSMWAELEDITPEYDPWSRSHGGGGSSDALRRASSPALDLPAWVRLYAQTSVSYYYFNNYTGDCVFETPRGYRPPADPAAALACLSPDVRAALCIQNAFRSKQARRVKRVAKARKQARDPPRDRRVWQQVEDLSTGGFYYCNIEAATVHWPAPTREELEEAADGRAAAVGAAAAARRKRGTGKPAAMLAYERGERQKEWSKVYDPASVSYYYYNNVSGESFAEQPEGYVEPPKGDVSFLKSMMSDDLRAALVIQGAYRGKQARRVAYHRRIHIIGERARARIEAEDAAALGEELRGGGGGGGGKRKGKKKRIPWNPVDDPLAPDGDGIVYYNLGEGERNRGGKRVESRGSEGKRATEYGEKESRE